MGKEGNQASSFADYAIPRFKDLRRVLFWHGRPYGVRLLNLANFVIYKAIIKSANNYALQWVNGFSGFQAVEGLMHIFFNILMTTFFNFIVSVYDQDVSFEKYGTIEKEKNLPVPMAEMYAFSRLQCDRKRFVFRMLLFDLYALITGFGIFLLFYYSQGAMNAKGWMYDVATYGVVSTVIVVYLHHVQVAISVRNWTGWILFWFMLSFLMMPLTCFAAQLGPYTQLHKSIYRHLVASPQLDAIILLTVGAFSAPLIFHKYVHQLILWPRYYTD